MNLIILHNAIRNEAIAQADSEANAYYTLQVSVEKTSTGTRMKFACYMLPTHKHFEAFDTPESLLSSIRGRSVDPDKVLNATPEQVLT